MFSLELLFGFIFWFCIIVAVITTLLANPVCRLLYGPEYNGAGVVLSISVWAGAFSMLGSARSPWIICENLQTYTMYYILLGMILKLLLNLIFIHFYGIAGAAFSTLFCQFSVALIFPLFFAKTKAIVYSELRGIYNIKKYLK